MDKWMSIMFAAIVGFMFAPVFISEHGKSECRIEAIKVNKSAEEIKQICK